MNARTTPKDFFMHLAATAFLYTTVVALIDLAFAVVNRALPDALQTFYGVGDLVWPISILIVLVPVVYILEWLIARDVTRMPEKKDIWIRRWRIYLTLFLTGVTILIDLIALINTLLNGEITSRFILKVCIVLVVSAIVFTYYILAKSEHTRISKSWRMSMAYIGAILVIATIISGFVFVGSPAKQRALRFDMQRVSDLVSIQYAVINYRQNAGKLPDSLSNLSDVLTPAVGASAAYDPETGQPYEYRVTGQNSYELCATFSAAGESYGYDTNAQFFTVPRAAPGNGSATSSSKDPWNHEAGRQCFERTIDPALYPTKTQTQK